MTEDILTALSAWLDAEYESALGHLALAGAENAEVQVATLAAVRNELRRLRAEEEPPRGWVCELACGWADRSAHFERWEGDKCPGCTAKIKRG